MKAKPKWPYVQTVQLRAHLGSGQWYKTIKGKAIYFGKLSSPDAALRKYLAWANVTADANAPAALESQPTLDSGFNCFLEARHRDIPIGSLSAVQYMRYKRACEMVLELLDRHRLVANLRPTDFDAIVKRLKGSPRTVGNSIRDIRVAFKWIADTYNVKPIFGQSFRRPSARAVRLHAARRNLWPASELRAVLAVSEPILRACIMLGINCAFGQTDCATIRRDAFNLEGHWFSRPKTGIDRRCPFWPETIAAIANCRRWRPDLYHELLFLSKYGKPLVRD